MISILHVVFLLTSYSPYCILSSWGWFGLWPLSGKFLFSTSRMKVFSFFHLLDRNLMHSFLPTHSIPSPLPGACNSTLFYYSPDIKFPSVKSLIGNPAITEELLSPLSRATMQVCFLYYCRIKEVLCATVSDIIKPDRVVLHGAKHSNSYVVYLPGLSSQISKAVACCPETPLFPISYIKLYRDALRIGINVRVKDSSNSRRLHSARYIFSKQSLKSINGSELGQVLRHRSNKNYLSYLK